MKSHNTDLLQKMDSTIENIVSLLRNMYSNCVMDNAVASVNHDTVLLILHHVRNSLSNFSAMFKTKAFRNLTLGTYPFIIYAFILYFMKSYF